MGGAEQVPSIPSLRVAVTRKPFYQFPSENASLVSSGCFDYEYAPRSELTYFSLWEWD